MKHHVLLAVLLVTAGLAGCFTPGEPTEPASTTNDHANTTSNPWQAGLQDHYPIPDVAKERSAEERRGNVAPPGDPEFAAFDAKMSAWMRSHNISAGQLAIMKDGQLRYEIGYGYTDRAGTEATNASTMFRLASVTKPITAALVSLQVEQDLYNWSDPVFCMPEDPAPNCRLPIEPHPRFPVMDDRLADVTVGHLINHTAGWGRSTDNLTFGEGTISLADRMGIETPPPTWRIAQYLMGRKLPNAPGEVREYCNVCYMFAGLVAEAATGAELGALYDAYLFEPLEIADDIEPGRTRPAQHDPREPFYHCEERATDIWDPNETTCEPYGEVSLDVIMGAGGLVSTAAATAAVYEVYSGYVPSFQMTVDVEAYSVYGLHCPPDATCRGHTGGFPGTSTASGIVEGDGWTGQFVFLFNKREPGVACDPAGALGIARVSFHACNVDDLILTMFDMTGAWAATEDGAPSSDASGGKVS